MPAEPAGKPENVSRRAFMAGAGATAATLGLQGYTRPAAAAAGADAADRPNILVFQGEFGSASLLGPYGDPLVRTPALDQLAAQSVRFTSAVASAPVCAPSRFSLVTGLDSRSCGPAEQMRASGHIPAWLRGFPAFLREAGFYCTNNAKTDYNAPIDLADTWDESSNKATWLNRPDGAPFFAVFNSNITHEDCVFLWIDVTQPDETDPAAVALPRYLPDAWQLRKDKAVYYDKLAQMDAWVAQRLAELDDAGLADSTIVFFYSDHGGVLPRTKRFDFNSGLQIPLLVRFPAKFAHLAPAPPGGTVDAPVSHLDLPPTMMSLAGLPVPDYMHGRVLAGANRSTPRTYAFSGRDRMDEAYDMSRTVRSARYLYTRNYQPHLIYGRNLYMFQQVGYQEWQRLYREGGLPEIQSAFWQEKPAEELYDLANDPDEVSNLAGSGQHEQLLQQMRNALDQHMLEVNDNGFIPEGSPLEGYDQSRQPGAYPLGEVMRVAQTAIQRDPANLPQLAGWLDDDNEAVRYQAALGCVMLGSRAAGAKQALTRRLGDDSWSVRVAAAEALCWTGESNSGLPVLTGALTSDQTPPVRLQAANALDHIGPLALPARDIIEQAQYDSSHPDYPNQNVQRYLGYVGLVLTGAYPQPPWNADGLSVDMPDHMLPGQPAAVTVTLSNNATTARSTADLALEVPDGWTVTATSPAQFPAVPPGRSVRASFSVAPPPSAAPGTELLAAQARYDEAGLPVRTQVGASAVIAPYAELAPWYNLEGVAPTGQGITGRFANTNLSYSAQALAAAGITPGATLTFNGITFTWPNVPSGVNSDNVACRQQEVRLHGAAETLGFLGASDSGNQSSAGQIRYQDGTSQDFTLAFTGWQQKQPAYGNELVATTPYTNTGANGTRSNPGSIFFTAVPLDPAKQLSTLVLPDEIRLHVFAVGFATNANASA